MEQYELLKYVVKIFEGLGIDYIITGSIASIYYGEPRFTNDIDIVAEITEKSIPMLLESFPQDEFYLSDAAIRDAICHNYQFNIIHPSSGLKIDVMLLKGNDFDKSRLKRRKRLSPAENIEANFASPEDVILMKMKYYKEGSSEKHIRDITGILKISGDMIDIAYIDDWAERLGVSDIWGSILSRLKKSQ